jgi:hypothetical protein
MHIGKVDPATALRLWNEGKSLREIARTMPDASYMSVLRAVRRAVALGLGDALGHSRCAVHQRLAWHEQRIAKLEKQRAAARARTLALEQRIAKRIAKLEKQLAALRAVRG